MGNGEMLTEKRRIEKARTPIKIRMKNARTLPNACRSEVWASVAAINGQIELGREIENVRESVFLSECDSVGLW